MNGRGSSCVSPQPFMGIKTAPFGVHHPRGAFHWPFGMRTATGGRTLQSMPHAPTRQAVQTHGFASTPQRHRVHAVKAPRLRHNAVAFAPQSQRLYTYERRKKEGTANFPTTKRHSPKNIVHLQHDTNLRSFKDMREELGGSKEYFKVWRKTSSKIKKIYGLN